MLISDLPPGTALSYLGQRDTGTRVNDMSEKVTAVLEKLNKREFSDAFLRNTLMDFLNEAQEQKRRQLDEKKRDLEEKRKLTGTRTCDSP